jgi:hypothetical protein
LVYKWSEVNVVKKVYKLNNGGTLGVSITSGMKDAGYLAGTPVEWIAAPVGFVLRIIRPAEIEIQAQEKKEDQTPIEPTKGA